MDTKRQLVKIVPFISAKFHLKDKIIGFWMNLFIFMAQLTINDYFCHIYFAQLFHFVRSSLMHHLKLMISSDNILVVNA